VYRLAVSGTTDAAAIAKTQTEMAAMAAMPAGTPLPALTGEPDGYDNKWLFEHGYGLRPDRATRPEHYARWRDSVTKPGVFVPLESSVEVPVSNGPNENLQYSVSPSGKGGWSGALDYNLTGDQQMVTANAEFKVPQVFAESNIGNISTASTWAGLGGFGNSPLWQTGIDEFTQSFLFFETATYHAFWQLWPNTKSNETFSVNNGDAVRSEVWICDIANGFAITTVSNGNARLCFWVHDDANNQTSSGYWTANPAGTWPTAFNTAEAIQEWNDSGANDYAQFNAFNFSQAWDITSGMSQRSMGSSSTKMAQIGNSTHSQGGSCMATTSGTCSDSGTQVRVWWNSHQ
jgi:hypothetical protein